MPVRPGSPLSRRHLLAGIGGTAGAAGVAGLATPLAASAQTEWPSSAGGRGCPPDAAAVTVRPDDPRYVELTLRGTNRRFVGQPEYVKLVHSTSQVVQAVQEAVDTGRRPVVRSGGHCFEDFVDSADVEVVIDMSPMRAVGFDRRMRAFVIEPGATIGELYRSLYYSWGVTLPAGGCADVGVGGHFCGGGYGPMSRLFGSVVDYLHAVEVVVVDRRGRAEAVVASRDDRGRLGDLWWAHTGGGGGNLGVVTRYWMRDPDVSGSDPSHLLPTPPATLLTKSVIWENPNLSEADFTRILANYGSFLEANSAPDSPYAGFYCPFLLPTTEQGGILAAAQMDGTRPDAEELFDGFFAALTAGVTAEPLPIPVQRQPWLTATMQAAAPDPAPPSRGKYKAGYLRRSLTAEQNAAIYRHLTAEGQTGGLVLLVPYGGKVNTVAPDATALPQRDSIMKAIYTASWPTPDGDDAHMGWLRSLYAEVYADTGGAPVPGEVSDGSYINYPDSDLADPELNTSGLPWSTLYYKDNYPRLQRAKAAWDPRGVFGHALAIEPPD